LIGDHWISAILFKVNYGHCGDINANGLAGARFARFTTDPDLPHRTVNMTKAIPFTQASIKRQILAIEAAGKFAVAVRPDGTVIIGDKPVDVSSLVPVEAQSSPRAGTPFWDKLGGGRMGDCFNRGQNDPDFKWEDNRV
jgi:hypothetical protein